MHRSSQQVDRARAPEKRAWPEKGPQAQELTQVQEHRGIWEDAACLKPKMPCNPGIGLSPLHLGSFISEWKGLEQHLLHFTGLSRVKLERKTWRKCLAPYLSCSGVLSLLLKFCLRISPIQVRWPPQLIHQRWEWGVAFLKPFMIPLRVEWHWWALSGTKYCASSSKMERLGAFTQEAQSPAEESWRWEDLGWAPALVQTQPQEKGMFQCSKWTLKDLWVFQMVRLERAS